MTHTNLAATNLTPANDQLYTMTAAGASPIDLPTMRSYLGSPSISQDALIQILIDACTQWGQKYTHREFTANTWELLINDFEDPICLRRNPIASITSVKYSVVTIFDTTVAATVFFLKKGVQISAVQLDVDQSWPTDGIDRDQSIKITFVTQAVGPDKIDIAKLGILRHVAFMFENRGDCGLDCNGCADAAGVKPTYDLIKIPNI